MGTLQLLERNENISNSQFLIGQALYSSRSLLKIVNDILDFSKIEANQLTIEQVEVPVYDLIDSIVSKLHPECANKNLSVKIECAEDFPHYWLADPVRLEQIIMNLVSNAVKFTEAGKITITVRESRKLNKDGVNITVSDTGIGISKNALPSLFDRFSQGDASTTRKYGGTGLGMSITKNLIDLMQGTIKVVSQEGKGTKFSVFLPLKKLQLKASIKSKAEQVSTPNLTGKTILIAEDNSINRDIIDNILKPTKAQLHFAKNGKQAIDLASSVKPDVILMDIQMPVIDGITAYKHIRKFDQSVPIIAVTANVMSSDIKQYNSVGFSSYVSKPFNLDDLYACLLQHT